MVTQTRALMVGTLRQRRGPLVIQVDSTPSSSSSSSSSLLMPSNDMRRLESNRSNPCQQGSSSSSDKVEKSRTTSPHSDNHPDAEDEDNEDDHSEDASLLQASTSDDDDSSIDSNCTGMNRIQHQFQKRGRILSRVTRGKSLSYHNMILAREVASREQILRQYKSKNSRLFASCSKESPPTKPWTLKSLYQQFWNEVLFEIHHSLEAAWIAIWYCLGHLSFFMTIDLLRRAVMTRWDLSEDTLHAMLILGGLTIMRVNGYLWTWLSQESYCVVKFDLHNRRILDHWDTRILAWFRQRKTMQDAVSMMGFYMLYLGITYVYERIWKVCEQWMWAGYHSWDASVTSQHLVPHLLVHADNGSDTTTTTLTTTNVQSCDAIFLNHWSWLGYLFKFWCQQFSNKDLWLVCILFDTIVVVMASVAMAIFGASLFED